MAATDTADTGASAADDEEGGGGYGNFDIFALDPETSRHPQEMYRALRDAPVLSVEGMGHILTTKEAAQECFRRPNVFSSAATEATLHMGTVRPLIPLQIDPPDHVKYRKILDPLFAPRHMAALEAPVAALVHERIDGFIDRGECDFSAEFSVPLPSEVFLTLLGLPLSDLPTFLKMKDGIIRPDHVVGHDREHPETLAYQNEIGASIYEYFNAVLDEREVERRDDLLSRFLDAEVDGHKLSRRRHPRRLLPVPHRRARHRRARRWTASSATWPRTPNSGSCSSTTRRSCRPRSRSCCGGRPRWAASRASPPRTPRSSAARSRRATW